MSDGIFLVIASGKSGCGEYVVTLQTILGKVSKSKCTGEFFSKGVIWGFLEGVTCLRYCPHFDGWVCEIGKSKYFGCCSVSSKNIFFILPVL